MNHAINDPADDSLDAMLAESFSRQLDGQLGRAEAFFRAQLSGNGQTPALGGGRFAGDSSLQSGRLPAGLRIGGSDRITRPWRMRLWWLPVTGAVAAGVTAIMSTLAAIQPPPTHWVNPVQQAMVMPATAPDSTQLNSTGARSTELNATAAHSAEAVGPGSSAVASSGGAAASTAVTAAPLTDDAVQVIEYRTVDEGTVVTDDQGPMRQVRQEAIEHVEWADPQTHQVHEMDIPHEQVVLVTMPTY
jgi:hypothetical protein